MEYKWRNAVTLTSEPYTCGYCSHSISSEKGYMADISVNNVPQHLLGYIYICHYCEKPTFFDRGGIQTPSPKYGNEVSGIEDVKIKSLYDEARNCVNLAPTSSILACRKLLMHIAVEKKAKPNLKFIQYVEYLSNKGYIPTDSKEWVDEIREKGNEATHEIVIMSQKDAKDLLQLTEMLLKIIYQFPADIKKKRAEKVVATK